MSTPMTYYGEASWKAQEYLMNILADNYWITGPPETGQCGVVAVQPQYLASLAQVPGQKQIQCPLITVVRHGLGGDPSITELDEMFLLVDIHSKKDVSECVKIYAARDPITNYPLGIRALWHNKQFSFPEVDIDLCTEVWVSNGLYNERTRTHYLSARYHVKTSAGQIAVGSI